MPATQPITRLLLEWCAGSEIALEKLTPLVYDELRRLAGSHLSRERAGHTLQPTALVHEAYMRLVQQEHQSWESRAHFFGVAARLMRQILVDWARRNHAEKRGGDAAKVPLEDIAASSIQRPRELIALDDALTELSALDERKAKVVELRYFGGMTIEEIAGSLSISTATVSRELSFAQLWLLRQMKSGGPA